LLIKVLETNLVLGNKYCCEDFTEKINDKYEEDVKGKVEEGHKILIRENEEWIDGEEYFFESEEEIDIPFEELFDGHYKKRIENIKEFSDDVNVISEILDYAKENDQPDSVLSDIEEYIEKLE